MAIQATPPIQLDPSMDQGHQLAFINQNLNNIASVIGQNSFVIVSTVSTPFSISTGASQGSGTITIPHNLGYIPLPFATVTTASGTFTLPYINPLATTISAIPFIAMSQLLYLQWADSTNFYVVWYMNPNMSLSGTIKIYALQQTAN